MLELYITPLTCYTCLTPSPLPNQVHFKSNDGGARHPVEVVLIRPDLDIIILQVRPALKLMAMSYNVFTNTG